MELSDLVTRCEDLVEEPDGHCDHGNRCDHDNRYDHDNRCDINHDHD